MDTYKIVYLVIGFIEKTNELVELYETDTRKKADDYKYKYESRKSIYNDFTVIEERIPIEYKSYQEYKHRKIKKK